MKEVFLVVAGSYVALMCIFWCMSLYFFVRNKRQVAETHRLYGTIFAIFAIIVMVVGLVWH